MKDKKRLIVLLVVVVVIVAGYYLGYKPIIGKGVTLKEEISALNAEIASLEPDYLRMAEIEEEIADIEKANDDKLAKYPAMLSEEYAFRLLFDIEEMSGVEFRDISFGEVEIISSTTPEAAPAVEDGEDGTNSEASPEVVEEKSFAQSVTTRCETDYEGLKEMLKFIYKYKNMTVIENLNVADIATTTDLSVNMQLQMIGVSSSPNNKPPKFDKVELGHEVFFDIFASEELDEEMADKGKKRREERKNSKDKRGEKTKKKGERDDLADILIDVHSTAADAEAQMIGMLAVNPSSSVINSDYNNQVSVTVYLETYGENIVATYYMNGEERSETFPMGKVLEMDIYSSERVDGNDLSSIFLNVNNTTPYKFYINIKDDDPEWSRIDFGSMQGDYEIR